MTLTHAGTAGTSSSGDILVTVSPNDNQGVLVQLTGKSLILKQFGRQIRECLLDAAKELSLENVSITAKDGGALDCTIRARVFCAVDRAQKAGAAE